jgi:hypothetical protein
MTPTQSAEMKATAAAAIIGAILLSLFDLQPVSATGVLLQEAMHFANPKKGNVFLGTSEIESQWAQAIVALRALIVILSLAVGMQIGRFMSFRASVHNHIVSTVTFLLLSGSGFTLFFIMNEFEYFSSFVRAILSAVFGIATGMIWGCMPDDAQTTARSALLKRAALGETFALYQMGMFIVGAFITNLIFVGLVAKIPICYAGAAVALGIMLIFAPLATREYLLLWPAAIIRQMTSDYEKKFYLLFGASFSILFIALLLIFFIPGAHVRTVPIL